MTAEPPTGARRPVTRRSARPALALLGAATAIFAAWAIVGTGGQVIELTVKATKPIVEACTYDDDAGQLVVNLSVHAVVDGAVEVTLLAEAVDSDTEVLATGRSSIVVRGRHDGQHQVRIDLDENTFNSAYDQCLFGVTTDRVEIWD